ncbi:CRISPR system precrRNA processing endoribonuclease RAMP protein Cas6 [Vibrio mexicanus]|uniref:CRISPR system precrRNA processing endoribonuclease RAMP protein Cas6 n=1 Tax=Vibrio mexicanus TaxID=1004326 RepID=UPI0009495406
MRFSVKKPTALKTSCKVIRTAPPLDLLVCSIARRLNALCQYWHHESAEIAALIQKSIPHCRNIETIDHTYWQEWQRYSKHTGNLCQFGGLQGMVSFQGEVAPALPWLHIGQFLQIGSKTTFGLGHYTLISPESVS